MARFSCPCVIFQIAQNWIFFTTRWPSCNIPLCCDSLFYKVFRFFATCTETQEKVCFVHRHHHHHHHNNRLQCLQLPHGDQPLRETISTRAKLMKHSPSVESMARLVCRAGEHMIQFVGRWNVVLHNIFPTTALQGTKCVFPCFSLFRFSFSVTSSSRSFERRLNDATDEIIKSSCSLLTPALPLITGSN